MACKTVFGKFCEVFWPTEEMAEGGVSRSDLNRKDNRGNESDDDEVQIVHETKGNDSDIRIIGEVASPEATFIPRGHSTILHSTNKKMQPFFISTKERSRLKIKPGSIMERLKGGHFGARQKFEASPGSWRTENLHSVRPTFKRRFKAPNQSPRGTPTRTPFGSAVRIEDFRMYAKLLNHSNEPTLLDLTRKPTSPSRTPLFPRTSPPIQRSVMRDQDSSQRLIDQMKKHQKPRKKPLEIVTLEDRPRLYESAADKDVIEIIDVVSPPKSPKQKKSQPKPPNTLRREFELYDVCHPDYLKILSDKYDKRKEDTEILIKEGKVEVEHLAERSDKIAKSVEERMRRHLSITEVAIPEPEEESSEDEEDAELPELTDEMESEINDILSSAPSQTLVNAHDIPITRKDLDTLRGLNWLNDEIINFYLQMIVARSKENENWPNVYTMNTFFLPKLMKTGFDAIKRWTRKVDIFSFDIILVPVHLDVHWCLAVMNLKKKSVNFYDSMGSDKNDILNALLNYLEKEHLHKKSSPFDTSDFTLENVKEIPKQMNGSDCGMFTLKYAEYLSRNASITFTQEDMPYFRRRMVYEIVNNRVIHP